VRLDLYLKTSRLVKRRAVAQELCEHGLIEVNGHTAKPAKEVRPGDRVKISYTSRTIELEVLGIPVKSRNASQEPSYRILSDDRTERPA